MELPSRTAEGVAALRHIGTKEKDPSVRGGDVLAHRFLGVKFRVFAMLLTSRARRLYGKRVPGTYEWILARSKLMDERFVASLEAGLRQVVILGAGYDTRAIRFHSAIERVGARVYELDNEATQNRKVMCLGARRVPQVAYLPVDFERTPLDRVLSQSPYDPRIPSLFVWEGVSMYLSERAVRETFASIASVAAPGSRVLFDYTLRRVVERRELPYGARQVLAFTASRGEPMIWGIEPSDLSEFASAYGFRVAQQWGPDDLERLQLTDSRGELIGRIGRYQEIAELERTAGPDLSV